MIHVAIVVATLAYVLIGEVAAPRASGMRSMLLYGVMGYVAAITAGAALWFRRRLLRQWAEKLQSAPDDAVAFRRWRAMHVIGFAASEAVVLYGLVLRFLGASFSEVLPFYLVGLALLFTAAPRRP